LGILAHVDAGKTSLTERLLYAAGVIDQIGSVDKGTTQTDSLALERQRGITIKSAVVSFVVNATAVNLIDTPGHPDFIAEVERVLNVLDGAVLVLSAVEGVQAQARVLMRALKRLNIPTLLYINKIDRRGADVQKVLRAISERLTPDIAPMGCVHDLGTRHAAFDPYGPADPAFLASLAEQLTQHDESLLADFVEGEAEISYRRLRAALTVQVQHALVHPVYCGSAITGAGIESLMSAITELLPTANVDGGPASGAVFKIERSPSGEKIAFIRMFSGELRTRNRIPFGHDGEGKVTAVKVFRRGSAVQSSSLTAGQIGKVWGLSAIQVGDSIGSARPHLASRQFAPPTLETAIVPCISDEKGALHAALAHLAEQDPLIGLRQDDLRQELYVSLYGEVQKEIVRDTLLADFGIEVEFRETVPICIERPIGVGSAVEVLGQAGNPFLATVGLRVEPAPMRSGIEVVLDLKLESMPRNVYKSVEEFHRAMTDTVRTTLREGIHGWQVTDCLVTMTDCGYTSPGTTAGDFSKLTPLVLMAALKQSGTKVCEPINHVHVELPAGTRSKVSALLSRLGVTTGETEMGDGTVTLEGQIPVSRTHDLQQRLPVLSRGEGVLEAFFAGYEPVRGTAPARPRTDGNPLNRKEYLLRLSGGRPTTGGVHER
jgi:ribosomal protection tetracycline resistance protein